jgi:RNA polymerase sigma-70 factor (ECF subfamily)
VSLPADLARAREQFLELVAEVRVELHRYCARLTGSVIEGEDVVQDTLAKALYALSLGTEVPELRPWLFRIAHNTAIDFLRSHERKRVDMPGDLDEYAGDADETADPFAVRVALSCFLALPVAQRSAVILKDVLGHSLEETAETLGLSVPAVKSLLVRGRAKLAERAPPSESKPSKHRESLERYVALFNARDWDGVRALVADDCALDLVSKAALRGKAVGSYFGRYQAEPDVVLRVIHLEGRDAIGVFLGSAERPAYFMLLEWRAGRVVAIRDYRYARYVANEAELAGD